MARALHDNPGILQPGRVILYLAGPDDRANRANIALLGRMVARSTTPLRAEVLYHRPLRLTHWAQKNSGIRFIKIRSEAEFVIAERIAAAAAQQVLYFDHHILAHPRDLWMLLGLSDRHAVAVTAPAKPLHMVGETNWEFAMRSARHDLAGYLRTATDRTPAIIALNRQLELNKSTGNTRGILNLKFLADIVAMRSTIEPYFFRGRSRELATTRLRLLGATRAVAGAFQSWRETRIFPYWFRTRHPLYLVAQLAAYTAALTLPATANGAAILFAFAILITLPYFAAGVGEWRAITQHPMYAVRRVICRAVLLFIG